MSPETINILILISPMIIGGIIAVINTDAVNNITEKVEAWMRRSQFRVSRKNNWFNQYIVNPILWMIVKFSDWTDSLTHRGLKNGIRVAASLYSIAAWCLVLYFAFMIVVLIAITLVVLYIVYKLIQHSGADQKQGNREQKRVVGFSGTGKRVNPKTGVIQKEGLFGYSDTDMRIDPKTGKYQKQGIFGWVDTETRIDQKTGKIQKEGMFGYVDTETRINPETGVIQKQGLFGWIDTDERIDPKTGRHQKQGLFGWVDD